MKRLKIKTSRKDVDEKYRLKQCGDRCKSLNPYKEVDNEIQQHQVQITKCQDTINKLEKQGQINQNLIQYDKSYDQKEKGQIEYQGGRQEQQSSQNKKYLQH